MKATNFQLPTSNFNFRLPRILLWAVVAATTGCGGGGGCALDIDSAPKGLYILCDGGSDLYYTHNNGNRLYQFSLECLGEEFLSETGLGGTGGEIDLAEWPNDTQDLEFLRDRCVATCEASNSDANAKNCQETTSSHWVIKNYNHHIAPDTLMLIDDPWHLECLLPLASLASAPWETLILPTGTSTMWPGTSEYITLDCGDFETCADEFDAAISTALSYDDTSVPWDADMGYADYLATTSTGSSQLEMTILNPGYTPSSDTHNINGRIEYSAPDCGETECPFYLANLTLTNTADTWELYSEDLSDDVYASEITLQLRRPTLGVWNTLTNQVYLGEERADFYATVTSQIGGGSPVESTYLATNMDAIFGQIGTGGEIEILDLVVGDGANLEFEADIDFGTLAGSPPTAAHSMSVVTAPNAAGFPVSSLTEFSSDPDADIDSTLWFVDGVKRLSSYLIAPGSHTLALRVIDDRGATDVLEGSLLVLSP